MSHWASGGIRHITVLVACLVAPLFFQANSYAQELDGVPEHVVKAALDPRSEVIYSGIVRKQLMRMGDAAAVAITRVLADDRPSADTVDRILSIVEFSFDSPKAITNRVDEKPETALFVLAHLDHQRLSKEQRKQLRRLTTKLKTLAARPMS